MHVNDDDNNDNHSDNNNNNNNNDDDHNDDDDDACMCMMYVVVNHGKFRLDHRAQLRQRYHTDVLHSVVRHLSSHNRRFLDLSVLPDSRG